MHQYRKRSARHKTRVLELLPQIRAVRALQPRVGGRKLLRHLSPLGMGRDKFFEILRHQGLLVKRRRSYTITTNSQHSLPVYPNLLPEATVDAPNQLWVADQTYIRLPHKFCYLSLLTDLWSRKIVGFDLSPTLEASGPLKALRMALTNVAEHKELIHHSDRGKQYCSLDYTQVLKEYGVRISMTAPRRPDQNAVAERINGILKTEFYLDGSFRSFEEARRTIVQSIYIYNNIRLHTTLGMVTPSFKHAA